MRMVVSYFVSHVNSEDNVYFTLKQEVLASSRDIDHGQDKMDKSSHVSATLP